jgi:pimeloyl-ACP methyl ester carboxylesterase
VSRIATHVKSARIGRLADVVAERRTTNRIYVLRILAALTLLAPTPRRVRGVADAVLGGSSAAMYPRQHYGTDGSDQVAFLVHASAAMARAGRVPRIIDICLWYIALQGVLSYAVSGWAKIVGPSWRSGEALAGIMRTVSYGDAFGWRAVSSFPRLARVAGSGVVAMECLFPLVFAWRGRLAPAFSVAAMTFHLITARLMGLGRFVTAFGAFHPAILYVTAPAARSGSEQRDDTLPRVTATIVGLSLAVALAAKSRRQAVVKRGRGDEEMFASSTGNVLAFRRGGLGDEDAPVAVFEAGLASTAEHWARIEEALGRQYPVVVYSRAGYGRSVYAHEGPFALDVSVRDLLDLVEHVAAGRRVVLVGHSLGGWIAALAAERRPELFDGVVLLDASHPGELERSSRQAKSREFLTDSLVLMPASLELGLGALLAPPGWIATLPESVRELAMAQYRDPQVWRTALREWRAAADEFDAFTGELPRLAASVLVLTAALTAHNDPIQEQLHGELAAMSANSRHEVIDRADHLRVLTDIEAADRVVEHIGRFVELLTDDHEVSHGDVAR